MNRKTEKNTTQTNEFRCEAMSHDIFSTKFAKDGHTDPLASTDYKEPPVVAYQRLVLGCDMYNFQMTGDIEVTVNATSCDSPSHSGPSLLILNDQGGDVMNVDESVTSTLRAQDHGHPPVVCFEPGILRRDCSAGNRAYIDICSTLRAQMGDNQPAVCYEQY